MTRQTSVVYLFVAMFEIKRADCTRSFFFQRRSIKTLDCSRSKVGPCMFRVFTNKTKELKTRKKSPTRRFVITRWKIPSETFEDRIDDGQPVITIRRHDCASDVDVDFAHRRWSRHADGTIGTHSDHKCIRFTTVVRLTRHNTDSWPIERRSSNDYARRKKIRRGYDHDESRLRSSRNRRGSIAFISMKRRRRDYRPIPMCILTSR